MSKRTIQEYLRDAGRRPFGQAWVTFLHNHAHETWVCGFLPVPDVLFRPLFACFLVELGSRRVVHVGVTRHPTDAWVTQQLREAIPFDERPRFLIRDNDAKYGMRFDQLAEASGVTVLRTPVRAPRQRDHGAVPPQRQGGVFRPPVPARRAAVPPHASRVCRLLQSGPVASRAGTARARVERLGGAGARRCSPSRSSGGSITPISAPPEVPQEAQNPSPIRIAVGN